MKKLITCIIAIALMLIPAVALAEDTEPTQTPEPTPDVVVINVVKTPEPTPAPKIQLDVAYFDHKISKQSIDEQAAIFWSECNTDEEKRCYSALAVNRMIHGDPFGDNLEDILSAKSEWHHGHISDRNREKAEQFLNMALTQYVDGDYAGLKLPSSAVYVKRESGKLVFMNIRFEEVYRLD